MKDFSEHSNSELISLLMDGQLDKEQEQTLYQNISGNPDMQEELQELISIRSSVKNDSEAYNPPAELTDKVFAGLGYSAPFGTAAKTATTAAGIFSAAFFKKALPYVAVVIAGVSLVLFNRFGIDNSADNESTASTSASLIAGTDRSADFTAESANSLAADNSENNNDAMISENMQNSLTETGSQSSSSSENDGLMQNNSENNYSIDSDNLISQINYKDIDNSGPATNEFIPQRDRNNNSFDMLRYSDNDNFDSYWYAQAIGIFAGSMAQSNLPTQSGALWSNINFGIFRQLNNDLSLGIQFGMEPYNIYETDNNDIPYLNSKEVFWVTAAGRYDMNFASLYSVTPYVSLAAGGSTVGFMSRGMAGFSYKFQNIPLSINAGYEASMINYSVYKDYTSTKNGFVAGFSVRF